MPISDVVVVGGGPAGLYAAGALARAGCDVTLFEEHPRIGEPVHCTGVLAKEAFDEFGIERSAVLNELTTVRFYAPSGDTIEYSPRSVQAVVIDRPSFDRCLAHEATRAGVRVVNGRVSKVCVDRDGVTVDAGSLTARGRACVLACGASYRIQRQLGLGIPSLLLRSAQLELPADSLGDVEVHFGRHIAPSGFSWAVPVLRRGRAFVRVGVMCSGNASRHFAGALARVSRRWGVGHADMQPRQKVLPLGPIARTYGNRVVVVGDAAGLVKSTTGGGIYYSLVSARLAADTLIEALEQGELTADRLAVYQTRWRLRLDSEIRSQTLLRRIAERLDDADIDGLFELARTDGIMPLLRRTATFNHHRSFIVALLKHPPARRVLFRSALA